jgi:Trk K+ transport system NAD-binding subunit
VTNDEHSNLAIAMAVRLLNPGIPVLARARSPLTTANMASFGTDHIISPFERFAEYLALAVAAPDRYRLIQILTDLPGTALPEAHRPPRGHWIVCGYGRFGQAIVRHLASTGIVFTVIDPEAEFPSGNRSVRGLGTDAATLSEAGIRQVDGIVAGSDNDVNNLSIAVTAKELNPRLFVVTRQNHAANSVLFEAFRGDFSMVPSRIVAQECIAILTTPLLARFLAALREAEEGWCSRLATRLQTLCDDRVPEVWGIQLNVRDAAAAHRALMHGRPIQIGPLLRDSSDRDAALPALVLMVKRDGDIVVLPEEEFALVAGDDLLLAGQHRARGLLDLTLQNAHALDYVLSGRESSRGWLWQHLFARPSAGNLP